MVSMPMKLNPFKEKMTAIRLVNLQTGQLLGTVSNFDYYPGSISLIAFLDFFNLKSDTDYIVSVSAHFPDGTSYPVHATRVNIPEHELIASNNGYGKATGNFELNFTINKPSDFYFLVTLIGAEGQKLDVAYSYHNFGTWR